MKIKFGGKGMEIVKTLFEEGDKKIGYDQFNQLIYQRPHGSDGTISSMTFNPIGSICPICNGGWEPKIDSIVDHYIVQNWKRVAHESCFIRFLSLVEFNLWYRILINAELYFKELETIKNRYGGAWNTDWYEVRITKYPVTFILGKRKKVYSIEVQGLKDAKYVEDLFEKEEVTKMCEMNNTFLIHAWNDSKAEEYINTIAEAIKVM